MAAVPLAVRGLALRFFVTPSVLGGGAALAVARRTLGSYASAARECWACGVPLQDARDGDRCPCGKLPLGAGEDHFEVLGLPRTVDDAGEVDRAHRKVQMLLHPDRFPKLPEMTDEQHKARIDTAIALSARASAAAATLRDPLARARYVLRVVGCPVDTEDGARNAAAETADDALEWLETTMEINEAVEDATGNADALLDAHERARTVFEDCMARFADVRKNAKWDGHARGDAPSQALCEHGALWVVRAAYMRTAMRRAKADDAFPNDAAIAAASQS